MLSFSANHRYFTEVAAGEHMKARSSLMSAEVMETQVGRSVSGAASLSTFLQPISSSSPPVWVLAGAAGPAGWGMEAGLV